MHIESQCAFIRIQVTDLHCLGDSSIEQNFSDVLLIYKLRRRQTDHTDVYTTRY